MSLEILGFALRPQKPMRYFAQHKLDPVGITKSPKHQTKARLVLSVGCPIRLQGHLELCRLLFQSFFLLLDNPSQSHIVCSLCLCSKCQTLLESNRQNYKRAHLQPDPFGLLRSSEVLVGQSGLFYQRYHQPDRVSRGDKQTPDKKLLLPLLFCG